MASSDEIREQHARELKHAQSHLRLPEDHPEPDACLAAIERRRKNTRNGDQLFFLWAALQRAEDRWGVHRREIAEHRRRFFDHVPAPPSELFAQIELPHGDRSPLWRSIPAGLTKIGSREGYGQEDERPRYTARIDRPFRISTVPITVEQYTAFDPDHPVPRWPGTPESEERFHPAGGVSWFSATTFCRWLASQGSLYAGARLPTEEEWEHACRAGKETHYWSGDDEEDLAAVGWYRANSDGRLHRVGEKPANPWGLYDVHGNVREWTRSRYQQDYAEHLAGRHENRTLDSTAVPEAGAARVVLRGGGYLDKVGFAHCAWRCVRHPEVRFLNIGFRVVLDARS